MLITVVTPTWQRHDLLLERCIPSVRAQTWREIEHIVVSDGPDPELRQLLAELHPDIVYAELPDHRDGPIDYGSRPRNEAAKHTTGEYVAYLDDDNAWRPEHLSELAGALDRTNADFAYSQLQTHPQGTIVGRPAPIYGGLDTSIIMHRAGVLERYGWWPLPDEITGDKHAPDWEVVARWLDNGATWTHVPKVTADYYFSEGS